MKVVGNGNIIIFADSILESVHFAIEGNNHKIHIGKGCRFSEGGSLWIRDHGCSLSIGDKTTFVNAHIAVTESGSNVQIGEDCMFAYDIDIRTGDSHSIIDNSNGKRVNFA
jgi:hypothetical protein